LYFNTFLRFYIESFLEINTAAYVNLYNLDFGDKMNSFCSIVSVLLVCISIVFPFANGVFLYTYKDKLEDTPITRLSRKDNRLRDMYGSLCEEYRMDATWKQYMHMSFFCVRRLAFILTLVYLPGYPLIQLFIFQGLNLFVSL
jgi:hypothetical protein